MSVTKNLSAMKGAGYYNANSGLQYAAMLQAVDTLLEASQQAKTGDDFAILDYGCSQGYNSLYPIDKIVTQLQDTAKPDMVLKIEVIHNDRPENDWETLLALLKDPKVSYVTKHESSSNLAIHPKTARQSYFDPTPLSDHSVNLGFSLTALHHLSEIPLYDQKKALEAYYQGKWNTWENPRRQAFSKQAAQDMSLFLDLRAKELREPSREGEGGHLVLVFVGAGGLEGNYTVLIKAMMDALKRMAEEKLVAPTIAAALDVPTHDRELEEAKESLSRNPAFQLISLIEKRVTHPACDAFYRDKAYSKSEYARVVVSWFFAVIHGYFEVALEKLQVPKPSWPGLTETFVAYMVDVVAQDPQPVSANFLYAHLRRV